MDSFNASAKIIGEQVNLLHSMYVEAVHTIAEQHTEIDRLDKLVARVLSYDAGPIVAANGFVIDESKEIPHNIQHFTVEKRATGWSICDGRSCLNKQGFWEYDALPSHREEEFKERTRWATSQEAFAFLEEWKPKAIQEARDQGWQWWHEHVKTLR